MSKGAGENEVHFFYVQVDPPETISRATDLVEDERLVKSLQHGTLEHDHLPRSSGDATGGGCQLCGDRHLDGGGGGDGGHEDRLYFDPGFEPRLHLDLGGRGGLGHPVVSFSLLAHCLKYWGNF